jgi:hypothetical protein
MRADGKNITQKTLPLIPLGIADIAEIAVIARDRKGKTIPRINADNPGSGNQNLTTDARRRGEGARWITLTGTLKSSAPRAGFPQKNFIKLSHFHVLPTLLKNIFAFFVAFANCLRYKP